MAASVLDRRLWLSTLCAFHIACSAGSGSSHDAPLDLGPPAQHRAAAAACTSPAVAITSDATAPAPACSTDSDCASDHACACDIRCDPARSYAPANLCVPAGCHTDADCGANGFCSLSFVPASGACSGGVNGAVTGFFCRTASDECTNDAECAAHHDPFDLCLYGGAVGHWICSGGP